MDAEEYEADAFPTVVGELQPGNDKNVKTVPFFDVKATPLSALLICSAVGVVRHALVSSVNVLASSSGRRQRISDPLQCLHS